LGKETGNPRNANHVAGGAYVEQQPRSEIAPAPTMEELQDLAGEASDKVHCSNIMGEMDTSAQSRLPYKNTMLEVIHYRFRIQL
ncbi:hypothetical protein JG687_00003264, partial [Phytophthora cactorum]